MKEFKQPQFLESSNIYEVNIRQYTPEGSFKAFMQHLPRLKDMGVRILWFMPIHPIGFKNRKGTMGSYYSIQDFCAVNPEFGTMEDFKFLVAMIHDLGMKIILDWVANHAAWDNVWTITDPDFFSRDEHGNFKPPYDWDDVIQINHDNPNQQQAMINAMQFWIEEFEVDGFRADLAHLTPLSFWKNARRKLSAVKEDLIWLAETEEPAFYEAFDICFTWKWMHATEDNLKGTPDTNYLRKLLIETAPEFQYVLRMYFTSNHDENSWNGTEYEKYGLYAKAFAVFSCTYFLSVPLIYSGQELPNLKRLKFFDKDNIEWNQTAGLHEFYKTLLQLRKRNSIFNNAGAEEIKFLGTDLPLLSYQRIKGNDAIVVVLNLSNVKFEGVVHTDIIGSCKEIFRNESTQVNNNVQINLQPGEFIVLEKVKA